MGIWMAYPAAAILSVIFTVLYLRSELKKMDFWFDNNLVREELFDLTLQGDNRCFYLLAEKR